MSTYEPGTVAMIRDNAASDASEWRAVKQDKGWLGLDGGMGWVEDYCVTDVRPLIVLDLVNAAQTIKTLRIKSSGSGMFQAGVLSELADQIEAQTKQPRIPEPGLWGVVEARTASGVRMKWTNDGASWVPVGGMRRTDWSELIDPVLIREGVQS